MRLAFDGPLVLVGAGKMGGALLEGLLARGLEASRVRVQDPSPPADVAAHLAKHAVRIEPSIETLGEPAGVIIVAVKPQIMDSVLPSVARLAGPGTLVISIAAGRTIAGFEESLPQGCAIVRAMPNTPAAIGRGITVMVANAAVSREQRTLSDDLLSAVGEVAWVEDEALMDAVTALSGSGPAYVFLLAEYLAAAGERAGLDGALARRLAIATVSGAGELMHRTGADPKSLRENVTSPGGTTAAALSVLMSENGLEPLLVKAVKAGTDRSRELAK